MLCVITAGERAKIYDLTGSLLEEKALNGTTKFYASSGRSDDPILSVIDDGARLKVFKLESQRMVRNQSSDDLQPSRFSTKIKINLELELEFDVAPDATSFQYVTVKGIRYFLVGDSQGQISVYHRNGTLLGSKQVAQTAITFLMRSYPNVLYSTKLGIGYFNPIQLETATPYCEPLPYNIEQVVLDLQQNNIVYVQADSGEVYVYEIKSAEGVCRSIPRIPHLFPS